MRRFRFGPWRVSVERQHSKTSPAPLHPGFASRIVVSRIRRGWSQEALAREIGYSVRTVRRWEEGSRPRPRGLRALADAFGTEIDSFYDKEAA